MTINPATTTATSSKDHICYLQIAPGGRAIVFIPTASILKQVILTWGRGVTYEWGLNARGKPVGIKLTPAHGGDSVLEVHQFPRGCGFRIPFPSGLTAKDAKKFVRSISRSNQCRANLPMSAS